MDYGQALRYFRRTDLFKNSAEIIDWVLAHPEAESHVVFAAGIICQRRQDKE